MGPCAYDVAAWRRAGYLVHGDADPDVSVGNSDFLADTLEEVGWQEGDDFEYLRLDGVTHRWQHQYNERFWDFLSEHPMPLDEAAP